MLSPSDCRPSSLEAVKLCPDWAGGPWILFMTIHTRNTLCAVLQSCCAHIVQVIRQFSPAQWHVKGALHASQHVSGCPCTVSELHASTAQHSSGRRRRRSQGQRCSGGHQRRDSLTSGDPPGANDCRQFQTNECGRQFRRIAAMLQAASSHQMPRVVVFDTETQGRSSAGLLLLPHFVERGGLGRSDIHRI